MSSCCAAFVLLRLLLGVVIVILLLLSHTRLPFSNSATYNTQRLVVFFVFRGPPNFETNMKYLIVTIWRAIAILYVFGSTVRAHKIISDERSPSAISLQMVVLQGRRNQSHNGDKTVIILTATRAVTVMQTDTKLFRNSRIRPVVLYDIFCVGH